MTNTINPDAKSVAPPHAPAASDAAAANQANGARQPKAGPVAEADRVQLTTTANTLAPAAASNHGAPMDAQRVAAVRQAIANGTYRVDPKQVAERLIAMEKQLG